MSDGDHDALDDACEEGDAPRVRRLLELGVDATEGGWDSPLSSAVYYADHVGVLDLLIAHGADAAGWRESSGRTLLHYAKSAAMVRALLAAGCCVSVPDNDGNTPLHWATTAGAARELLRADPAARNNKKGETPLHCQLQQAPLLLAHAAAHGGAEAARALLDARDDRGHTPLARAAGHYGMRWLLTAGRHLSAYSDWTAADAHGRTALHDVAAARAPEAELALHRALLGELRALLGGGAARAFAGAREEAAGAAAARACAACDAAIAALGPAAEGRALRVEQVRRACERDVADADAAEWAQGVLEHAELPAPHRNMAGVTLQGLLGARDAEGRTAMHVAARAGKRIMLRALLEAYADAEAR